MEAVFLDTNVNQFIAVFDGECVEFIAADKVFFCHRAFHHALCSSKNQLICRGFFTDRVDCEYFLVVKGGNDLFGNAALVFALAFGNIFHFQLIAVALIAKNKKRFVCFRVADEFLCKRRCLGKTFENLFGGAVQASEIVYVNDCAFHYLKRILADFFFFVVKEDLCAARRFKLLFQL